MLLGVALLFYWLLASKLARNLRPLGGIAGLFLRDSRVCIVKYLCNYVCRACFQNQKFFQTFMLLINIYLNSLITKFYKRLKELR